MVECNVSISNRPHVNISNIFTLLKKSLTFHISKVLQKHHTPFLVTMLSSSLLTILQQALTCMSPPHPPLKVVSRRTHTAHHCYFTGTEVLNTSSPLCNKYHTEIYHCLYSRSKQATISLG